MFAYRVKRGKGLNADEKLLLGAPSPPSSLRRDRNLVLSLSLSPSSSRWKQRDVKD
jgi:hypothetical protein